MGDFELRKSVCAGSLTQVMLLDEATSALDTQSRLALAHRRSAARCVCRQGGYTMSLQYMSVCLLIGCLQKVET